MAAPINKKVLQMSLSDSRVKQVIGRVGHSDRD